jgi:FKBP-type peptidyl-prolyl cis-trans isomerase SlyD
MEEVVNDIDNPTEVKKDVVVSLDYTLKVDGEIVDSSEGMEPLQFIQGQGQIIPGLETELYGMSVGDRKNVTVPPERGYGDVDPENFAEIPRAEFPPEIPLQPGIQLEMTDQDGDVLDARIVSVDSENVRLDFNHPLAGKELNFSVEVIDLRQATPDELAHGHAHPDGDYDEDEEFDELDEEEIFLEEDEEGFN